MNVNYFPIPVPSPTYFNVSGYICVMWVGGCGRACENPLLIYCTLRDVRWGGRHMMPAGGLMCLFTCFTSTVIHVKACLKPPMGSKQAPDQLLVIYGWDEEGGRLKKKIEDNKNQAKPMGEKSNERITETEMRIVSENSSGRAGEGRLVSAGK